MEYAGWHAAYHPDTSFQTYYDEELELGMQGCLASRFIYVSGDKLQEIEESAPQEADWILSFKFNHAYEV